MISALAHPTVSTGHSPASSRERGFTGTAALLGVFGFLVSFAGAWQPSYWGDEAASVMSAERSLPSLFRMLGNVDAVHGTYYLFLHGWIDLFGASEFSTRLPSALAIGAATAGTAVLARRLFSIRTAVFAALVFAFLPRVTFMGEEARSTAFATAIAVWSTVLLLHLLRASIQPGTTSQQRRLWWAGYAALFALGIYMFLYLVLLLPAHALTVWLFSPRHERARQLRSWAKAGGVALGLALPVLVYGIAQHGQISFLAERTITAETTLVTQWFGTDLSAVVAWLLIGAALVSLLVAGRRAGIQRPSRPALTVLLVWAGVPTAILLVGTHLVAPMYSQRYLSFCTPAVAVVIAVGIVNLRVNWLRYGALLLLIGLMIPTYLAQRTSFAKDGGSDWRQAAAVVAAGAQPGDAVVFDDSEPAWRNPRLALHVYPQSFRGLRDVTLATPYADTSGLRDTTVPLADVTDSLAGTRAVWVMQFAGSPESRADTAVHELERVGFTPVENVTVHRTTIIEMTR